MKYRKKPVVIEAVRVNETGMFPAPIWYINATLSGIINENSEGKPCIKTLEGEMTFEHGDYIIQGIKGEIYPCKPDIFEASYEVVSQSALQEADNE